MSSNLEDTPNGPKEEGQSAADQAAIDPESTGDPQPESKQQGSADSAQAGAEQQDKPETAAQKKEEDWLDCGSVKESAESPEDGEGKGRRVIAVLHVHGMGEQARYGTIGAAAAEIRQALCASTYAHPCSVKGFVRGPDIHNNYSFPDNSSAADCNCTQEQYDSFCQAPGAKAGTPGEKAQAQALPVEPAGARIEWLETTEQQADTMRFYKVENVIYKTQVLSFAPSDKTVGVRPLEIHVMETYWAPEASGMNFWSTFAWLHKAWLALFRLFPLVARHIDISDENGVKTPRKFSWAREGTKRILKLLLTMYVLIILATFAIGHGVLSAKQLVDAYQKKGLSAGQIRCLLEPPADASYPHPNLHGPAAAFFSIPVFVLLLCSVLTISNLINSPMPRKEDQLKLGLGPSPPATWFIFWVFVVGDALAHVFLWGFWISYIPKFFNFPLLQDFFVPTLGLQLNFGISFILISFLIHLVFIMKMKKCVLTGQSSFYVCGMMLLFLGACAAAIATFAVGLTIPGIALGIYIMFYVLAWRWFNYWLSRWFGDVAIFTNQDENSPLYCKRTAIQRCMMLQLDYVFGTHEFLKDSDKWEPQAWRPGGAYDEVIIYGHSLGCIVAYNSICDYFRRIFESGTKETLAHVKARFKAFLTTGCHLDIVEYLFDPGSTDNRYYDRLRVFGRYAVPAGSDPEPQPLRGVMWLNIWNWWDVFSSKLFQYGSVINARVSGDVPLVCHSHYMQIERARGLLKHVLLAPWEMPRPPACVAAPPPGPAIAAGALPQPPLTPPAPGAQGQQPPAGEPLLGLEQAGAQQRARAWDSGFRSPGKRENKSSGPVPG
ncbi:hypothetical protein IT575_04405 [bacterium]|nr:hypothetical protein [bacterium]